MCSTFGLYFVDGTLRSWEILPRFITRGVDFSVKHVAYFMAQEKCKILLIEDTERQLQAILCKWKRVLYVITFSKFLHHSLTIQILFTHMKG